VHFTTSSKLRSECLAVTITSGCNKAVICLQSSTAYSQFVKCLAAAGATHACDDAAP
jgi:hypothetical protein